MPFRKALKSERKSQDHDRSSKNAFLIPCEDLKVIKDLGEGQYGMVRLAEWKPPHEDLKLVAIKSIKSTTDGVLTIILKEAETMQKLCHENVVKLYGISLPSGKEQLRLVTEFAPYGSLDENFKKKNKNVFKVLTVCKFVSQVACGMHYLASQHLVHRDLATRNILLFEQDLVKISDFGLAQSLDEDTVKQITPSTMLAVAWMPPEVITQRVFSSASDMWSFGITLWEMFSFGQQPWAEYSLEQIKQMVANDSSKRLVKPYACPDGFYELVMLKSWENNPEDRPTFEDIINNVLPQIRPKEGTTKVAHKSLLEGHLSHGSKEKFIVISRVGDGKLLVQSENGAIGLIDEKHVEFHKKVGATVSMQISRPFEVKKRDSKELLAELQKNAGEENFEEVKNLLKQKKEKQPVNNLLDLDEDDVALDPNYMLYPDPYPAMSRLSSTNSSELDRNDYIPIWEGSPGEGVRVEEDEDDYVSMGHACSSEENLTRPPGQCQLTQRPGRTMSESEILRSDSDCQVPFQNMSGSKDDSSVQLGLKGTLGDKKIPPIIPSRLDLIRENSPTLQRNASNDTSDRHAGPSPNATTLRKRPVPTPRRKTIENLRPVSDSYVDMSGQSDLEESIRCTDTQNVACEDGQRKVPPKIPLPHESTRTLNDCAAVKSDSQESNKHRAVENIDNEVLEKEAQANLTSQLTENLRPTVPVGPRDDVTPVEPHAGVTASAASHGEVAASLTRHGDVTVSVVRCADVTASASGESATQSVTSQVPDVQVGLLIDLSSEWNDLPPLPPKQHAQKKPVYSKPLSLAMYPNISKEVVTQPPPPPRELFGGPALRPNLQPNNVGDLAYSSVPLFDLRGGLVTSHQPPFNPLNNKPLSSSTAKPVEPVYERIAAVKPGPGLSFDNPNFDFHNPVYNPDISTTNLPNPTIDPDFELVNQDIKPANAVVQPAHPDAKPVDQDGVRDGRSYGNEIDAGIQKIQEVCGMDVSRDWCYAALLQYQGDVEQVVHIIKIQKLATITGKTEQFCERTLSHCSWDLNRAAVYILENYPDKDV